MNLKWGKIMTMANSHGRALRSDQGHIASEIPNGWFSMETCPENVFVTGKTEKYELKLFTDDCIAKLRPYLTWQPIPGVTPAFGPWIDGVPEDTRFKYIIERRCFDDAIQDLYEWRRDQWQRKNGVYIFDLVESDAIRHCRAYGAVREVG